MLPANGPTISPVPIEDCTYPIYRYLFFVNIMQTKEVKAVWTILTPNPWKSLESNPIN
jgi:hypothetical protein